jgi:hypothetical protein
MTTTEQNIPEIYLIVRGEYDNAVVLCAETDKAEAERLVQVMNAAGGPDGPHFSCDAVPVGINNIGNGSGVALGYDV